MSSARSDDVTVAFGHVVRRTRLRAALSQEAVAERAGLHRTYIGDIERGTRNVGLRNIRRLAQAMGVSMAELMAETEGTIGNSR
jgi:transcriptional regulator with XRE-family HTH domain